MRFFRPLIFLSAVLLSSAALSGCWQERPSYSYLMLHPDYLQKNYNQCVQEVVDPALPCETILRAQADFTALSNQRAQDPERFGARVLQEQENLVYLKSRFEATWQDYRRIGESKPSLEEVKQARMELDKRKKEYKANEERVKILLSVIAATSNV